MLRPEVRTLAELLRNRGFATGGAVSTFLLRSETGVAQGFSFFEGRFPESAVVERDGPATAKAALAWLDSQAGQRFFLFIETPRAGADGVVAIIVARIKERDIYDDATVFVVGGADHQVGARLDDAALRVAFVVKHLAARCRPRVRPPCSWPTWPDDSGAGSRADARRLHAFAAPRARRCRRHAAVAPFLRRVDGGLLPVGRGGRRSH